jgi:hypothetical protein
MKIHHYTVAIDVLAKEKLNIFSNVGSNEFKSIWTLIIARILPIDMAKHFSVLKNVGAMLDEATLNHIHG